MAGQLGTYDNSMGNGGNHKNGIKSDNNFRNADVFCIHLLCACNKKITIKEKKKNVCIT